jgi:hypothetical protein
LPSSPQPLHGSFVGALCIGGAVSGSYLFCFGSFALFWFVWREVCCLRIWRRPTFPRLETQYHGLWRVSRPSSERDRVLGSPRGHQIGEQQGEKLVFLRLTPAGPWGPLAARARRGGGDGRSALRTLRVRGRKRIFGAGCFRRVAVEPVGVRKSDRASWLLPRPQRRRRSR